ncbi:MAG: RrF2 family transcriptional regulator [Spirochaetota bacterium]
MVRISKAVEYALVAVRHMNDHPESLVSARDLSEHYDLPSGLLAKIMQRLAAAGVVESEQGVRGGYRLARDPGELSFLELSEAVEGPIRTAACDTNGDGSCERTDTCTVAGSVHELSARIVDLLAATSVGELLEHSAPAPVDSGRGRLTFEGARL